MFDLSSQINLIYDTKDFSKLYEILIRIINTDTCNDYKPIDILIIKNVDII